MAIWRAPAGIDINYELYGGQTERPVLVLLPGLLGSISSQWRQFIQPLQETHRLLLLDWRGHGRSTGVGVLRPAELVADLFGLLDHLGLDRVHVAGYSLGGYLGFQAALTQPRRIQTLLVHSTRFYWTAAAVEKFRPQIDPDVLSTSAPAFATQLAQEHGASRWRTLARETGDLLADLSQNGLTEGALGRLQIPVLVSVGDRDEILSLPESARLARALPQGGLLVLPHTNRPIKRLGLIPLLPVMREFHR